MVILLLLEHTEGKALLKSRYTTLLKDLEATVKASASAFMKAM